MHAEPAEIPAEPHWIIDADLLVRKRKHLVQGRPISRYAARGTGSPPIAASALSTFASAAGSWRNASAVRPLPLRTTRARIGVAVPGNATMTFEPEAPGQDTASAMPPREMSRITASVCAWPGASSTARWPRPEMPS